MSEDTFRWVIAGGVAISTLCVFVMAGVAVGIHRLIGRIQMRVESVSQRAEPLIDMVRKLTAENGPKLTVIATHTEAVALNAKDISEVARTQAHRFAEVGRDLADRTMAQVARVDSVVDQTVGQVQVAGSNVKDAMMKPVREASGVVAGIRAAVHTIASSRRPSIDHATQDEEMFI